MDHLYGAVKGKPLLVEKNQQPLGFILRLEEELGKGKKNIMIVLFFVTVTKYVTTSMKNCILLEFAIMWWANDGN